MVTEERDFADVDPRVMVSEQFFSGRGWSQVKGWMDANIGQTGQISGGGGGGCGV
jgi:hypothetical protein